MVRELAARAASPNSRPRPHAFPARAAGQCAPRFAGGAAGDDRRRVRTGSLTTGEGGVRIRQLVIRALGLLLLAAIVHAATGPTSSRALSSKLAKSGRAEAKFVEKMADPLGEPRQRSGSVALESGQRVRLDYG